MGRGFSILAGILFLTASPAWAGSLGESWSTLERVHQDRLQVQRDFIELDRTRHAPGRTDMSGWGGRFSRDQAWLAHEEQAIAQERGTPPAPR